MNYLNFSHQDTGAIVEVTLTGVESDVFLVDPINLSSFQHGGQFHYTGGHYKQSPVRLRVPSSDDWTAIVIPGAGGNRQSVGTSPLAHHRRRRSPPPPCPKVGCCGFAASPPKRSGPPATPSDSGNRPPDAPPRWPTVAGAAWRWPASRRGRPGTAVPTPAPPAPPPNPASITTPRNGADRSGRPATCWPTSSWPHSPAPAAPTPPAPPRRPPAP